MFSEDQIKQLSAKLDKSNVKERTQANRKLPYIEGWHAIAEANRIFGFDAWTRKTLDIRMVAERERPVGQGQGWGVSYVARVRVTVGGIVREGIGAGHGIDRDLGLAHESAIKEAETDAMKRALMTFGNPFGLALYDKTQENVETQPAPRRVEVSSGPVPVKLSPLGETYRKSMETAETKDELGEWMSGKADEMKQAIGEAEAQAIRALAAARYRELPETAGRAA